MIELLVKAGADPNATDADGHRPWAYFARLQRRDEAPVLIKDFSAMCRLLDRTEGERGR